MVGDGLTAFLGVNNSGKSSLLKFFFEFRDLFNRYANGQWDLMGGPQGFNLAIGPGSGVFDIAELFSDDNSRDLTLEIRFDVDPLVAVDKVVVTYARNTTSASIDLYCEGKALSERVVRQATPDEVVTNDSGQTYRIDHVRAAFLLLSDTLYIGAFRNVLNIGATEAYFDIQTGQAFVRTWKQYKTGASKAQNEATYRVSADIRRIFRFSELEINAYSDDTTLQLLINGKSHKLPAVGSGIAQFILVLATAAIRAPSLILIDEPELNLHPSLQLDFLTTVASYASRGVLFGTHNVGLARSAADRLYAIRTSENGSILSDYEAVSSLAEFLGELSYSGYRALGYGTVLLVEGRTEVRTIQQFLRLYDLDHKVVLVPLGGGEMINGAAEPELAELARLSDHVYALIDSERAGSTAALERPRAEFQRICGGLGIECKVLDRRATENYFTGRAVKMVYPDKNELALYEKLGQGTGWPKRENWRIAKQMLQSEIDGTDLGSFLKSMKA